MASICFLMIHVFASGQVVTAEDSTQKDEMVDPVEIIPSFPGGQDKLARFVKANQKRTSFSDSVKGKVFVQFVVEKTGELTEIEIVRGLNDQCNNEAIRLLRAMPKWNPGSQGGKLVRTRMVLPLVFNQ
jgi:periplasmic protein TonB